ncbi:hypothetical protein IAF44_19925, partial [Acinetobacter baumannii]|nr:hypothetical protein [Acinetobacter baumannii]
MVESGYKSSLLTDQDVLVLNDHLATVHYHLKIIIEYQHGASLAKVAHQLAMKPIKDSSETLKSFSPSDQAKILEMAY